MRYRILPTKLSVEIDAYQEKDYNIVDEKMELLNLKPRDRVFIDCYMGGMTCNEIAAFLDIDRTTVLHFSLFYATMNN